MYDKPRHTKEDCNKTRGHLFDHFAEAPIWVGGDPKSCEVSSTAIVISKPRRQTALAQHSITSRILLSQRYPEILWYSSSAILPTPQSLRYICNKDKFLKWKISDKLSRPCLTKCVSSAEKAVGKTASWTVCQSALRRAPQNDSLLCSAWKAKVAKVQSEMTHFTFIFPPRLLCTPHWLMFLCQAIWLTVACW